MFYQVQNNAAEIEAMRSGRLHVAGFSTGPTVFAVNKAGAIPFAVKGDAKGFQGYNLITIVKASSAFKAPADLKGKKVAHTAPSSNSGHLAPLALLPAHAQTTYEATLQDIQATLGMVPDFMARLPPAALPGLWSAYKGLYGPNTVLPPKYRSLISLAVSAQIPCEYCVSMDTADARLQLLFDKVRRAIRMARSAPCGTR